jgi:hypothetical protein
MAENYTKLLSSITDSSVWKEDDRTLRVWIAMLAMADRDGYVWASVDGLAYRARVTEEEAEAALAKFMSPDKRSRSRDHEGRRIEEVDRGWLLLNHSRFRDMRDEDERRRKERERKRAQRAKEKAPERYQPEEPKPEPPDDFNGSPNETICPANLLEQATPKVLPELAAKLKGATIEQVTASANRFCSYYVIGKGMGQKRRFWMRELRNWIVKDHGANKLTNAAKGPRNAASALYARALAAEAEDKRLEAERQAAE